MADLYFQEEEFKRKKKWGKKKKRKGPTELPAKLIALTLTATNSVQRLGISLNLFNSLVRFA